MTEKTFLLVCEGETDVYIFQALAEHLSSPTISLKITSLAPQLDATSGSYPSHSFGSVLNWCAANKNRIQMLIDFKGASALFLQMDTDIVNQANPNCINQGFSARHCCQERINQELATSKEPPRCFYILPTQNTETWLLASQNYSALTENLEPINDYELIPNTEQQLISLGYPSKKGKNSKTRKLNKEPATKYKNYGAQLVANLASARQKCAELDRLCSLLQNENL